MRERFDLNGDADLKAVVAQYRDKFKKRLRWLGPIIIGVIAVLVVMSGLYSVEPGEVGVVRTFGKQTGQTGPGLHFAFPIFQRVDIVNREKIWRIEVGFQGNKPLQHEAQMITGDQNIVEAQMTVQYRIADPAKWLFRLKDPCPAATHKRVHNVLHDAAEVALRDVVGRMPVDLIMTEGRGVAQTETKRLLQELMDRYESGLEIVEVKLQEIDPPEQVKDAFHDVVRALEEKQQKRRKAQAYREDILPRAEGKAQKMIQQAEAYKIARIERAYGDANKFDAVLKEYQKAKGVTRQRLHLETMETILSKVKHKVLIDEAVAKNALPVLPLGGVIGGAPAAVAGTAKGGR